MIGQHLRPFASKHQKWCTCTRLAQHGQFYNPPSVVRSSEETRSFLTSSTKSCKDASQQTEESQSSGGPRSESRWPSPQPPDVPGAYSNNSTSSPPSPLPKTFRSSPGEGNQTSGWSPSLPFHTCPHLPIFLPRPTRRQMCD